MHCMRLSAVFMFCYHISLTTQIGGHKTIWLEAQDIFMWPALPCLFIVTVTWNYYILNFNNDKKN